MGPSLNTSCSPERGGFAAEAAAAKIVGYEAWEELEAALKARGA
jgi:hypothetical protein